MPLIAKPNYNQIFASQAPEQDKPAVFNNYPSGWGPESRPNNGKPTIKGFNYLQQTSDLKDLWILQNGACLPYDESIEYAEGAPVLKDGVIQYKTASGFKSRDAVTVPTYNNPADGVDPVTGVAAGAYFNVRSTEDDTVLVEYQNVGGSAVSTGKSYPSGSYVETIAEHTALPFKAGKSYALYERVQLNNGDIVKSTVANNTANPNVDMTGWENPKTIQQSFNDKYSKFKQPESGAVEQDLAAREKTTQLLTDYSSAQLAFDAQRSNTSNITVPLGVYSVSGNLSIKKYHNIQGVGDASVLKFVGAGNGIIYADATGVFDDHSHRTIKYLRIQGDGTTQDYLTPKDGTTIGYQVDGKGHLGDTEGLTLDRHDIGMKISRSYTNRNTYNHYRANKVGLHLSGITSHTENQPYFRYNTTAAILITGAFENATINGGAIEGNGGVGIQVRDITTNFGTNLTLNDLYMESNGNADTGLASIDIQEIPTMTVNVNGGNYWLNVIQGVTSGAYKWGNSVAFRGTKLDGNHYAKYMSIENSIIPINLNSASSEAVSRRWGLVEPTIMLKYQPLELKRFNIFQTQAPTRKIGNLFVPDTAKVAYPYTSQTSGVTIAENTTLNNVYQDGSWQDLTFSNVGNYSANYAELFAPVGVSKYKLLVFRLIFNSDAEIGFAGSNGTTYLLSQFKFKANKLYTIVLPYSTEVTTAHRLRMFSLNANSVSASFKPLHDLQFNTQDECLGFINKIL